MKTKLIKKRVIKAYRSNPDEVLRLMNEADKITLSDNVYEIAIDVVRTVDSNIFDEYDKNTLTAVYLMKIAYILHKEGKLA